MNIMLLKSISDPVSEREEAAGGTLSDLLNGFLAAELAKTRKDDPLLLLTQAELLISAAMRMLRRERAQTTVGFLAEVKDGGPQQENPQRKKKRAKKT